MSNVIESLKSNGNNIVDLEQLHSMIEVILREHGNLPLSVSVLQEPDSNPYSMHFEDRALCANIEIVNVDGRKFVELAV